MSGGGARRGLAGCPKSSPLPSGEGQGGEGVPDSLRLPVPGEIVEVPADDRGDGGIDVLMDRAGVTQTELVSVAEWANGPWGRFPTCQEIGRLEICPTA